MGRAVLITVSQQLETERTQIAALLRAGDSPELHLSFTCARHRLHVQVSPTAQDTQREDES